MSTELHDLEASLQGLRPAALDRPLLARLEDALTGQLTVTRSDDAEFEALLRATRPAELPPGLMAALEAAIAPPAANVIPFPRATPAAAVRARSRRPMWASAAAVALLGAATALFMPGRESNSGNVATHQPLPHAGQAAITAQAPPADSHVVPASFNTAVADTSDEGVVWQSGNRPCRVVKVTYNDRVTVTDANGRKIECEKPRVTYVMVPEKID